MTRRFLLLSTLLLTAAFPVLADDPIVAAEKAWAEAVTSRNFAKLQRAFDDELIYAHSTGGIETKAEYLAKLKSGTQRYDAIIYHKTTTRMHGDAAVAHSIVTMRGASKGTPFDNKLMMIHTWVKKAGEWRLAAHQTTLLEE